MLLMRSCHQNRRVARFGTCVVGFGFFARLVFSAMIVLATGTVVTAAEDLSFQFIRSDKAAIQDARAYLEDVGLQSALDQVSRSELTFGNSAQILASGIMSRPVRAALINNAKTSIVINSYSINSQSHGRPDGDAQALLDSLGRALDRGVRVSLLVDGFTSAFTGIESSLMRLRERGARVERFRPIVSALDASLFSILIESIRLYRGQSLTSNRMHEKVLIVDRQYAVVGGLNWGESYSLGDNLTAATQSAAEFSNSPLIRQIQMPALSEWGETQPWGWRDTDVLLAGPVVESIARAAEARWKDAGHEIQIEGSRLTGAVAVGKKSARSGLPIRYIVHQPLLEVGFRPSQKIGLEPPLIAARCPQANITNFYINTIRRARRQIVWGGHSVTAKREVTQELIRAANRGVNVHLITNSRETAGGLPDGGKMFYLRSACWTRYALAKTQGNLRVFGWQPQATVDGKITPVGSYHSKLLTVDGYLTAIGSYNIAPGSYCGYTENTAVIVDADFARSAENFIENDLKNAKLWIPTEAEGPKSECDGLMKNGHWLFLQGYMEKRIRNLFSGD